MEPAEFTWALPTLLLSQLSWSHSSHWLEKQEIHTVSLLKEL